MVVTVGHVDLAVGPDSQAVHTVELTASSPAFAELGDVVAVGIQDDDARVDESVGNQHPPIGQERHILRPPQMGLVVTADVLLAQRHQ